MKKWFTALALTAAVAAIVATPASASAASAAKHDTRCAGYLVEYWVFDTARPSRGWFLMNSGDFTSGMQVGFGGTLVLGPSFRVCVPRSLHKP